MNFSVPQSNFFCRCFFPGGVKVSHQSDMRGDDDASWTSDWVSRYTYSHRANIR
jgi:hypothetical protein